MQRRTPVPHVRHIEDDLPTDTIEAVPDQGPVRDQGPVPDQRPVPDQTQPPDDVEHWFGGRTDADDADANSVTAVIPRLRPAGGGDPPDTARRSDRLPSQPTQPTQPSDGGVKRGDDEPQTERFAAYQPGTVDAEDPRRCDPPAPAQDGPDTDTSGDPAPGAAAVIVDESDPKQRGELAPRGGETDRRPVLLVATLLLLALAGGGGAWYFQQQADVASRDRPVSNLALLDKAATAAVVGEISKAIEAAYSYDGAALDQSETRALSYLTGSFVDEYKRNFAAVRALGPRQRPSLTSKVVAIGVISLTEHRASLLAMVNQEGHQANSPQPIKAAIRLTVSAERVDGQWKVSEVNER